VGLRPLVCWNCECCVLSGSVLQVWTITRTEESYRVWCVRVWSRSPIRTGYKPESGRSATGKNINKNKAVGRKLTQLDISRVTCGHCKLWATGDVFSAHHKQSAGLGTSQMPNLHGNRQLNPFNYANKDVYLPTLVRWRLTKRPTSTPMHSLLQFI
jgi:hypothetical protein